VICAGERSATKQLKCLFMNSFHFNTSLLISVGKTKAMKYMLAMVQN